MQVPYYAQPNAFRSLFSNVCLLSAQWPQKAMTLESDRNLKKADVNCLSVLTCARPMGGRWETKAEGKNAGLVKAKDLSRWGEVLTESHKSHEVNDPIKETPLSSVQAGEGSADRKRGGKLAERANLGNLALERFSCMRSLSWSL